MSFKDSFHRASSGSTNHESSLLAAKRSVIGRFLSLFEGSSAAFACAANSPRRLKRSICRCRKTPVFPPLKRVIESGSDVRVVTSPKEADAISGASSVNRSRDIPSINDAGRAREYELTMTLEFRVVSPDGFDFVETTRLATPEI